MKIERLCRCFFDDCITKKYAGKYYFKTHTNQLKQR